jgi:hypothetical protein
MKTTIEALLIIAISCAVALLSGCYTPPKVDPNLGRVAQQMGIQPDEVRFLSHCSFDCIPADGSDFQPQVMVGVVALTELEIHVFGGDFRSESACMKLIIPIQAISGVGLVPLFEGRQLQLLYGDQVIVIWVRTPGRRYDRRISELIYDELISKGVPNWESGQFYAPLASIISPVDFVPPDD